MGKHGKEIFLQLFNDQKTGFSSRADMINPPLDPFDLCLNTGNLSGLSQSQEKLRLAQQVGLL